MFLFRFTANEGVLTSDNDEFYFLTDPEDMNYLCHPYDDEKQLLAKPWTREMFFTSPDFKQSYFSSGWKLHSPSSYVLKPDGGYTRIEFISPRKQSQLKYKLFYDEKRSGKTFPQELQTDQYIGR